ncbi:MAG: glycosyltransferase, partial [Muribaculaceae bacterium]|nr:glycosyltransferase [Muribaculaceae bacterium]
VGSVFTQTCGSWELICFNDASTDGSLELLRGLQARSDGRMHIIDSPVNVKQGGGRNRALQRARGRYVMFLDADDALAPDAVESCLEEAGRGADMVVFDYARMDGDRLTRVCQLGEDAATLGTAELRRRIVLRTTPVWSAMYERSLIADRGLFFPEGVFYEDNAVAMAIQLSARKPVKLNAPLYRYRVDNASVTRSTDNYRFFHRLASARTLLGHLKRLGLYEEFAREIDFLFINQYYTHTVFGCVYRFSRVPMLRHRYVCRTIRRYVPDFSDNPYYRSQPLGLRLKIVLHVRFPRVIHGLSRLKRRLTGA